MSDIDLSRPPGSELTSFPGGAIHFGSILACGRVGRALTPNAAVPEVLDVWFP